MPDNDTFPFEKKCTNCQNPVYHSDEIKIRKGGLTGLLADWGEIFETHIITKCYKCNKCGHLDFYQEN